MADIDLESVAMEVNSLISGRQSSDPRLYDAIVLLNNQIERITQELSPLVRRSQVILEGPSALPAPTNFRAFSAGSTVRFLWDQVSYASLYEVREGTDWDTAFFRFRTAGLQGDIDPLLYGAYNFLIKTLDSNGLYSVDASSAIFSVPTIPAPEISVSVIDNNVLLSWTEPPSTFNIAYYIYNKTGTTEASGIINGNFTSIFEVVAGVYQYTITAVDVAGNHSIAAEVEAIVNSPPDFAITDTRTSDLMGTRVNVIRIPTRPSLLCCWLATDWEHHFTDRVWLDPEDQVTAGYPIYIQPTTINGSYEEIIDYGVVIHNVILTINWNTIFHTPQFSMGVIVQMAFSEDGVTYTPFISGSSQFTPSVRYLKFRLEFTAENDKTLIEIFNLVLSMSVKRENDGGEVFASSADVGGTTVYFNKQFKDVESLTCTTKSTLEPFITIFDFADIPEPTFFKVFVFDTMGARVSRTVDWKARGIV